MNEDDFYIENRESLYDIIKDIYDELGKDLTLSMIEDLQIFVNSNCKE